MHRTRLFLCAALLLALACSPPPPPPPSEPSVEVAAAASAPDPVELLEAANQALLAARWLEFDFEYLATHAGRGRILGHAAVEPIDRDPAKSRFRIDARMGMPVAWLGHLPSRVVLAQDEGTAWRLDPGAGRAERATLPDGVGWSPTINLANTVLPVQLFRERPMSVEIDDPTLRRYAGTALVGDVACDVVFLAFAPESGLGEQYLYLGRDDHLPRRIVLTNVEETEMGPPMAFDLILTNLVAGSGPPPFDVAPDLGADFVVVDRDADSLEPGDAVPDWRLDDLHGRAIAASDLRGSVVVLEFWATWCPTCRATLPLLDGVREEFADRPVRFFAVQAWDDADPRPYLEGEELDLEVLVGGDALADRLKVYGTSQNVVIDANGRIVLHDLLFPLAQREERLREAVLSALAAGAVHGG